MKERPPLIIGNGLYIIVSRIFNEHEPISWSVSGNYRLCGFCWEKDGGFWKRLIESAIMFQSCFCDLKLSGQNSFTIYSSWHTPSFSC